MSSAPASSSRYRLSSAALVIAATLFCSFVYFWMPTSTAEDINFRGARGDYYNLLSHGFLAGHLYMQVDPVATPAVEAAELHLGNMPFLLDASFYEKHYYLYFGPAPVVVLFLPYHLLTGSDLSDHLAAAVFSSVGLAIWVLLFWQISRRYYSTRPDWILPVLVLLLGLGNAIPIMLRRAMFYETAIGSAYCFLALSALCVYQALAEPLRRRRCCIYLAGASLAFGLAVGSRASYALGGLGLLIPFAWICRSRGVKYRRVDSWLPEFLATVAPIGTCAVLLAVYNYERFGSPLEFGVKYQFTYKPVFGLRFAWYNLKLYYGLLSQYSQYFPFAYPVDEGIRPKDYVGFEHIHGQAWSLLLLPLLLASWFQRRPLGPLAPSGLRYFLWFNFGNNLLVLLCLAGRANRYAVDFHPLLLFQIALAALAWSTGMARARFRVPWAVLIVTATIWGALHNIFSGIQLYNILQGSNPPLYQTLAHALNGPTAWRESSLAPAGGAVRMEVTFPRAPRGAIEPLLVTGIAEYSDYILVQYLEGDQVIFVFDHPGYWSAKSEPLNISRDHSHSVEIDLGSLYPPREHPFFIKTPAGVVTLLKRRVQVSLDGKRVLETASSTYDASPDRVYPGRNPFLLLGGSRHFTGHIVSVNRAGWFAGRGSLTWPDYGAVEMKIQLPATPPGGAEPLVVTGRPGQADGIYLRYIDASHLRFGSDRMGVGGSEGPSVAVDFKIPHTLEISMGSLFPPAGDSRLRGLPEFSITQLKNLARVKLDGVEVFRSAGPFHEASPATLDIGGNAAALSSMSGLFTGTVLALHRQAMPTQMAGEGPPTGAVRLRVRWPTDRHGQSEPLVATGETGRADIIFAHYIDADHIRFGLDHWGVGVVYSAPLSIDYNLLANLEINLGSLYPTAPAFRYSPFVQSHLDKWRDQYDIILNGKSVFSGHGALYTSSRADAEIGTNLVGASSCESSFTGVVQTVSRPLSLTGPLDQDKVVLEVIFPPSGPALPEPLVVTGRTGAADGLLLKYPDDSHLQFVWDHWGAGGPASPPIEITKGRIHRLEIQMGSLLRPDGDATKPSDQAEIRLLRILVDERLAWQAEGEFYDRGTLSIGKNTVGLSSASPSFTGTIEYYRGPLAAEPGKEKR